MFKRRCMNVKMTLCLYIGEYNFAFGRGDRLPYALKFHFKHKSQKKLISRLEAEEEKIKCISYISHLTNSCYSTTVFQRVVCLLGGFKLF